MSTGSTAVAACVATCVCASAAFAQVQRLTLTEVLVRAREQAPELIAARLAVDEARAQLTGASIRWQANPEIEGAVGNRNGPDTRFTDFEVGIGQDFQPGSRRTNRMAVANATIARSMADLEEVTRQVLRSSAAAFFQTVYARERIDLLNRARDLAANVHSVADRRFKAGDIAVLDVNIARVSLARAESEIEAAEALRSQALGQLRQLLRLEEVDVDGSLTLGADLGLESALAAATERPEFRALAAAIEGARAELQLAETFGKPDYGLGFRYAREEGDHIVLGGLTVTLPVFSSGQGERALATARLDALRAQSAALQTRVRQQVTSTFEVYRRRLAAVRALESGAIPGLDENEQLTTRSFEVGQLGLIELLLLRREILETRIQYLDALLEAVLAQIDFDASAGRLR
jgi:cobalt-zinc-cadmium efflux system outer membrane protein